MRKELLCQRNLISMASANPYVLMFIPKDLINQEIYQAALESQALKSRIQAETLIPAEFHNTQWYLNRLAEINAEKSRVRGYTLSETLGLGKGRVIGEMSRSQRESTQTNQFVINDQNAAMRIQAMGRVFRRNLAGEIPIVYGLMENQSDSTTNRIWKDQELEGLQQRISESKEIHIGLAVNK